MYEKAELIKIVKSMQNNLKLADGLIKDSEKENLNLTYAHTLVQQASFKFLESIEKCPFRKRCQEDAIELAIGNGELVAPEDYEPEPPYGRDDLD